MKPAASIFGWTSAFQTSEIDEVREALIGAAEIGEVDQVDHRGEGREVGQRVLRGLDRAALHGLRERTARAELSAGGELDVDLAVRRVLDVLLEVQLHDRIGARGAEHIGCRDRHDVLGGGLAGRFLLPGLRDGFAGQQRASRSRDDGGRERASARQLQKRATLEALDLRLVRGVLCLHRCFLQKRIVRAALFRRLP